MPEPLGTIDGPCFTQYVNSLDFVADKGPTDVERRCTSVNPSDCAGSAHTKTDLEPERYAKELGVTGLKPNGHVVARIHVKGDQNEARYGLPGRGEKSYMLITNNQAQFVHVKGSEVVTTHTVVYRSCGDDGEHPKTYWGDFRPCPTLPPGPQGTSSAQGAPVTRTYDRDEPAWLSCAAGCCVAEAAELNQQGNPP